MAGIKGRSGPPGNANAFQNGLSALQDRRENDALTSPGETIRAQILSGLISDKGGDDHVSTSVGSDPTDPINPRSVSNLLRPRSELFISGLGFFKGFFPILSNRLHFELLD